MPVDYRIMLFFVPPILLLMCSKRQDQALARQKQVILKARNSKLVVAQIIPFATKQY